jgi:uncharacterized protein YkwD
VLVLAAVVALGASACLPTTGADPVDPYVNMLFQAMNRDRAANGLPRLTWSPKLSVLAYDWSAQMSQEGVLHHQDLGAVINRSDYSDVWTLGENILVGPAGMPISDMENLWMSSAGHRANILSGNFNIVGLAFVSGPDGRLWVTVNFGAT